MKQIQASDFIFVVITTFAVVTEGLYCWHYRRVPFWDNRKYGGACSKREGQKDTMEGFPSSKGRNGVIPDFSKVECSGSCAIYSCGEGCYDYGCSDTIQPDGITFCESGLCCFCNKPLCNYGHTYPMKCIDKRTDRQINPPTA